LYIGSTAGSDVDNAWKEEKKKTEEGKGKKEKARRRKMSPSFPPNSHF